MSAEGLPPRATPRIDLEIAAIKGQVHEMGQWAIGMVQRGVASLGRFDAAGLAEMYRMDDRLDAFDVDIEHEAIRLLITRQPAARDARTLGAVLKVITYLDRVGRLGLDTARYVPEFRTKEHLGPWSIIEMMAEQATTMLRVALDAFDTGDLVRAKAVYEADDAVDELNRQVLRECLVTLEGRPPEPPPLVVYVLVSRHLERVADNACKIAEKTIYMETGHRRREFLTPQNKVRL